MKTKIGNKCNRKWSFFFFQVRKLRTDMPKDKEKKPREPTAVANKRLKQEVGHSVKERTDCPYLSTISRGFLNFDNERKCSVTLVTNNIYMCLVCGELFHGRGLGTPAHTHSLGTEHYVFVDTGTGQVWCIPDMYEVRDDSLSDIVHNVDPCYSDKQITDLLTKPSTGYRITDRSEFSVGYVGLNNLKQTDPYNASLQMLLHVSPLVKHFLQHFVYQKESKRSHLRDSLGELYRKIWNPFNYVGQVSPRSFIQELESATAGQFAVGKWEDPQVFLHRLLTLLNMAERKARKSKVNKNTKTIIEEVFQGEMSVTTRTHNVVDNPETEQREVLEEKVSTVPFFTLPIELPKSVLSQSEESRNSLPQEHLQVLFEKYNGVKERTKGLGGNKAESSTYKIVKLPRYLILFFDRFKKDFGTMSKIRTLVNTPLTNLDLSEFCTPEAAATGAKYDLCSVVVHEGGLGSSEGGFFKTYQHCKQRSYWLEMEDLRVTKIDPIDVSVCQAYIQVWERKITTEEDS
eukprot:TRINITY_DN11620_c0_g1_i1.p1 TRINITY_DN11620_c0_g1~~TRINITY_DN11620_c0_g1_i1.p1  ORF type:complete len:516 (+),score=71.22 TRINITY_DN11620_c0_g1_i1:97-1644(+)